MVKTIAKLKSFGAVIVDPANVPIDAAYAPAGDPHSPGTAVPAYGAHVLMRRRRRPDGED